MRRNKTYTVLMWINKTLDAVLACLDEKGNEIFDVIFIIDATRKRRR